CDNSLRSPKFPDPQCLVTMSRHHDFETFLDLDFLEHDLDRILVANSAPSATACWFGAIRRRALRLLRRRPVRFRSYGLYRWPGNGFALYPDGAATVERTHGARDRRNGKCHPCGRRLLSAAFIAGVAPRSATSGASSAAGGTGRELS